MKMPVAAAAGGALLAAAAWAAPPITASPTPQATPSGLLGVIGGDVRGAAPTCPVVPCLPGDQGCLQAAFQAVRRCADAGLAPELSAAPGATVFRAHGGGYTLYGTLSPGRGGPDRDLLSAWRLTLEPLDEPLP
ncbi:MAG: hypothetical protein H6704_17935 [Myxococcales bacterium]|nr:hypothetical protein [Myxococcales bacterium]